MSKNYETKQVILVRTDLKNVQGNKVKSAKMGIQMAHAGMIWLSKRVQSMFAWDWDYMSGASTNPVYTSFSEAEKAWLKGSFAKIALAVDSEEQLRELVKKAHELVIEAHICTDAGKTEFGGVPTVTCAAIGPATSYLIDRITGHLRPL